mgnify:CR=1 FL=1
MIKKQRLFNILVFVALTAIILSVFLLMWQKSKNTLILAYSVSHTNQVIGTSEKVISLLKDIETGQRGYLLTKDSLFLEPFNSAVLAITDSIASLKKLTSDNQNQQPKIDSLAILASKRVARSKKSIEDLRYRGLTTPPSMLSSGRRLMDSARIIISNIQKEEEKLLKQRKALLDIETKSLNDTIITILCLLSIFILGAFIYNLLINKKLISQYETIAQLNKDLSKSYEELQTASEELHATNEELTTSNEELFATNEQLNIANNNLFEAKKTIENHNTKTEAKLANVLETSLDMVCFSNTQGTLSYINPAGRKLMGIDDDIPPENIVVRNFHTQESWDEVVMPAVKAVMEKGFWEGNSEVIHQKKGHKIPVWQQFVSHKNSAGEVEYLSVITKDMTNLRKTEQELKENEKRYRLLFKYNPQPMWMYETESGKIVEVNNAAIRKYGYLENEFLALNINDIRPKEEKIKLKKYLETLPEIGANFSDGWKHITKEGKVIDVEIYSHGFELNNKKVRLILANDVTEKKKAEENLRNINAELVRQNEQLDKYVYVVSHNIRGPVASLQGLANMLNFEKWPEKTQQVVDNIQKMAQKLDDVILDLNKVLSNKNNLSLAIEKIDLNELTMDIVAMLQDQIEASDTRFIFDFNIKNVQTVKSYLHSVFINLISNAIKYRHPDRKPTISISSRLEGAKLCISFVDNGLGIDLKKEGDKIFGLYKRFHHHIEGKGLGLHLVKSQLEAIGGKIEVESQINKGTTFKVFIPL